MGKSANESFQIAHAELTEGRLTMVLHVKGKPPTAGVCCWKNRQFPAAETRTVDARLGLDLLTFKTYTQSEGLPGITLFYVNIWQDFGSAPVQVGQGKERLPTRWFLPAVCRQVNHIHATQLYLVASLLPDGFCSKAWGETLRIKILHHRYYRVHMKK